VVQASLSLTLTSPSGRAVTFPNRALLAPMEGVTDPAFRRVVLGLGHAGGACTEFQRITTHPLSRKVARRELGERHPQIPTGIQIMAAAPDHVAESVRRCEEVGAPFVDLNFGCPVKCVFGKGAGAALLDAPHKVGAIVAAAVGAATVPVTAKIRAGVDDASRLGEVVAAVADAGAAALTVHARLRRDSYDAPARWEWIAACVAAAPTGLVVIGNGGIEHAADVQRMLDATGCDAVMVGRAAMRDPFLFGEVLGHAAAEPAAAARFLLDYDGAMHGAQRYRLGRLKQLVRVYDAGRLFSPETRRDILRAHDASLLRAGCHARIETGVLRP